MRRMTLGALLAATALAVGGGCRSSALQKDQDRFRQTILDSYTNQIMDNLIRASNAMPIVQVDFTNVTGTITDVGSAGTTPSQTVTNQGVLTLGALKAVMSRAFTSMFTNVAAFSVTGSRQQQLAVTGVPVVDKPEVYRAYLDFLSKPGSLVRDCDPPPPDAAHIVRNVDGVYFYVPTFYKKEFFELTLKTTVMRGQPATVPEVYTTRVDKAVALPFDPNLGLSEHDHLLTLTLDKTIPNDSGTLKFSIDGRSAVVLEIAKHPGPANAPTDTLSVAYNDQTIKLTPRALAAALQSAKSVEVLLLHNRPTEATTDDILKSIFTQVQLNRLDNLRLLNPR